jgi:hypothetical protein
MQLKPGHITRDQLVAHAFLLLVAGNATGVNFTPVRVNQSTSCAADAH